MARLWRCPECGKSHRAPDRLAKRDVRRYCLGCSQTTGVLVERVVPSRERANEVARLRGAKKRSARAAKRKREALDAVTVRLRAEDGRPATMNVAEQVRKLERLPAFGGNRSRLRGIRLEVRQRSDGGTSGRCAYGWRIVVSIGSGAPESDALALIIHEMAHEAARTRGGRHHDLTFKRCQIAATRQAFPGITLAPARKRDSAYEIHGRCCEAIHDWLIAARERGEVPARVVTEFERKI